MALLSLDQGSIRVAEYLTVLPPREVLERELFEAIRRGREQVARHLDAPPPSLPAPAALPEHVESEGAGKDAADRDRKGE